MITASKAREMMEFPDDAELYSHMLRDIKPQIDKQIKDAIIVNESSIILRSAGVFVANSSKKESFGFQRYLKKYLEKLEYTIDVVEEKKSHGLSALYLKISW